MRRGPGCVSEDEAIAFVHGAPTAEERAAVLAHIESCGRCRILIGQVAAGPSAATARSGPGPITTLPLGTLVEGRYRITRFIAAGGMGEVYAARDTLLDHDVALKTLPPTALDDERAIARIKKELLLAWRVSDPNVCRLLEFGVHQMRPQGAVYAIPFLTMELLQGETLGRRLRRAGPLSIGQARPLVAQLLSGIEAIHRAGVVHRDLKSDNVFLAEGSAGELRVVVMDLGLARTLEPGGSGPGLTGGAVVGTMAYMAPEQLEGRPPTVAFDIYALGVVLYEMLTGALPFQGSTAIAAALKRFSEDPVPPSRLMPVPDPAWDALVLRCLARDPGQRFSSIEQVRAAVGARSGPQRAAADARLAGPLSSGLAPTVSPASVPVVRARPRWRVLALVAAAIAAGAGGGGWALLRGRGPGTPAAPGAQPLGPVGAGPAAVPVVVGNGRGAALAAWRQSDGKRFRIWANLYRRDSGWGTARPLDVGEGDARSIALDLDARGNGFLAWRQSNGRVYQLWTCRVGPGGWERPVQVEPPALGAVSGVDVALDGAGNAWLVWQQAQNRRESLWAMRCPFGKPCSGGSLLEHDDAGDASDATIRQTPDGQAFAIWHQRDGEERGVWTAFAPPGGSWGPPRRLQAPGTHASSPRLAVNARGQALATWRQSEDAHEGVWSSLHEPGRGWSAPRPVIQNAEAVGHADVGIDAAGNGIATWRQTQGTEDHVFGAVLDPTGGWGAPVRLDAPDAQKCGHTDLAMDEQGAALVAWQQESGGGGVWASRFDPRRGWTAPFRVDPGAPRASEPVVTNRGGLTLVVWHQSCGRQDCTWGRLLGP